MQTVKAKGQHVKLAGKTMVCCFVSYSILPLLPCAFVLELDYMIEQIRPLLTLSSLQPEPQNCCQCSYESLALLPAPSLHASAKSMTQSNPKSDQLSSKGLYADSDLKSMRFTGLNRSDASLF